MNIRLFFILIFSFVPLSFADTGLTVSKVIDGDSVILSDGREVRLIGIDCPEFEDQERNLRNAKFFGINPLRFNNHAFEAMKYLTALVSGRNVRTEIDPADEIVGHHDEHGRFLAYLYVVPDDLLLNAALVHKGDCLVYRKHPFRYRELFLKYEKDAKEGGRGLWG